MNTNNFNEVYGYDHIKKELIQISEWFNNEENLSNNDIYLPKGILLFGAPGTGKTLLLRNFINCFSCPIINIEFGESIDNIKQKINDARKHKMAIVTIDELDKMLDQNRSLVGYFQSEMDGINQEGRLLFIATANDLHGISSPLRRKGRFDRIIEIDKPSAKTSKLIFVETLKKLKLDYSKLDIDLIGRIINNPTGAEIKALCNDMYLRSKNKVLTMEIFDESYVKTMEDLNNLQDRDFVKTKRIAVHEAGHILAGLKFNNNFDFYKADLISKGGFTKILEKDSFATKEKRMQLICISLAGYAAEKVVYKDTDLGSVNDIYTAYDYVARLIERSCCFGLGNFQDTYNEGREDRTDSPFHQAKIETKVIKMVNKFYKQIYRYLKKHKKQLLDVADILFEKEKIRMNDIVEVI